MLAVLLAASMLLALGTWAVEANAAVFAEPGFAVGEFAGGFPTNASSGPTALAIDRLGDLLAVDSADGNLYEFSRAGGRADASTRKSLAPLSGYPAGMALDKEGDLFVARDDVDGSGDVAHIDPVNGKIIHVVVSGFEPRGLATDPLSDDLFVTSVGQPIKRIGEPASLSTKAEDFGEPLSDPSGIAFGPDGTIYVVNADSIIAIDGTASASPGLSRTIAHVSNATGIAVAMTTNPSEPPFLAVNSSDGSITKIDLAGVPAKSTPMVSGGTRGEQISIGPDGCLYATQSQGIEKVTASNGTCPFCDQPLPLLDGGGLADDGPCGDWRATRERF